MKLCQAEKKTPNEWMTENGFTYEAALKAPILAKTKVNAKKRMQLLLDMKNQELSNIDYTSLDEIGLYRINLETSLNVIKKLKQQEVTLANEPTETSL